MKRPFPRFEVLGLTAALALGGSCTPNNSVKPGAPVLTEMVVLENGTPYKITSSSPQCSSTVSEGAMCDPQTDGPCQVVGGSEGGAPTPPNWCRCRGVSACPEFAPSPNMGTWNCGPFAPTTPVIAVFDRVLDTAPFDLSDGGPLTNVASLQPATPMANLDGVYTPNGSPEMDDAGNYKTLLFPIYQHCVYGTYGTDGPSLMLVADPQLPTGSTVTVKLDPTTVLAKDGRTPFASSGALLDGMVTFQTTPFDATLTVPTPPPAPADAGAGAADGGADGGGAPVATVPPDMTAVEIDFTAPVDVTKDFVDIKVVVNGATELQLVLSQPDGGAASNVLAASPTPTSITLTPVSNWPASSTITVTVEATTTDLLGEPLPTAKSATFVTGS